MSLLRHPQLYTSLLENLPNYQESEPEPPAGKSTKPPPPERFIGMAQVAVLATLIILTSICPWIQRVSVVYTWMTRSTTTILESPIPGPAWPQITNHSHERVHRALLYGKAGEDHKKKQQAARGDAADGTSWPAHPMKNSRCKCNSSHHAKSWQWLADDLPHETTTSAHARSKGDSYN